MFERVIAQTIQKITAETLQERSLIPLIDILQDARIPGRIKPFFETEVHWWLYNDALARAANKRFDYEHPELASLLNYIEQVQFRHARFEREEFVTVLDSAVKLIYNYLCRPQTTLKWYIFRGQPVKPLNEVMLRFGAFIDYEYFRTVFTDWVERKRAERPTFDAISATEFERVIRRIDDQILLNCTVEGLLEMMDPLFEFIGEGTDQLIPIDALVIFFDDKNIKKLVDQLESYRERGGESVGREGFVALLDELLSTADDEPEVDFSSVYQNDALDEVVRQHLQSGARGSAGEGVDGGYYQESEESYADPAPHPEEPVSVQPVAADEQHVTADAQHVSADAQHVTADAQQVAADAQHVTADAQQVTTDAQQPAVADAPGTIESEEIPGSIMESPAHDQFSELPGASALQDALDAVQEVDTHAAGADPEPALLDDDDDEIDVNLPDEAIDEEMPLQSASQTEEDLVADWLDEVEDDEEEEEEDDDDDEDHELDRAEALRSEQGPASSMTGESPAGDESRTDTASAAVDVVDVEDSGDDALDERADEPMRERPHAEHHDAMRDPVSASPGAEREMLEASLVMEAEGMEADDEEEEEDDDEMTFPAFNGSALAEGLRSIEERPREPDMAAPLEEIAPQEAPAHPMEDVRRFIDAGLERKVVKKIFQKNRAEYDAALDRINSAPTWRLASQVLDELFIRYDVDPYSRTAIRFTDSVYGRYLPGNR